MKFNVVLDGGILPTRATDGSAAFDLYVPPGETWRVYSGSRQLFGLRFSAEFDPGHVALIFPRSGVALKAGVSLANAVAVIDSDYRGEWKLALQDLNFYEARARACTFSGGERIAQVVFLALPKVEIETVSSLAQTLRGTGGFGSTGA